MDDSIQLFNSLCNSLSMGFVCDESFDYFVANGYVWKRVGTEAIMFDDRVDLFISLRNVAVNIVPNTIFRNADYIYRSEGRND